MIKVFAPLLKIKDYILLGCIQGGLSDFFGNSLICEDMWIDDERFCSGFQLCWIFQQKTQCFPWIFFVLSCIFLEKWISIISCNQNYKQLVTLTLKCFTDIHVPLCLCISSVVIYYFVNFISGRCAIFMSNKLQLTDIFSL